MHAEEIMVVEDGTIVERGTHEQLLKFGGWYRDSIVATIRAEIGRRG